MTGREMTYGEAAVVEAAVDLITAREGARYGPLAHEVKRCEEALDKAVCDLLADGDGTWTAP